MSGKIQSIDSKGTDNQTKYALRLTYAKRQCLQVILFKFPRYMPFITKCVLYLTFLILDRIRFQPSSLPRAPRGEMQMKSKTWVMDSQRMKHMHEPTGDFVGEV